MLVIGYNHTEVTKRQGSVAENWTLTQTRKNIGGKAHIITAIGICVKHTSNCYSASTPQKLTPIQNMLKPLPPELLAAVVHQQPIRMSYSLGNKCKNHCFLV